jgi:hypothetical protein
MLEWMIAIAAVCGAISGVAILYITLRAAMQMRGDRAGRKATLVRVHGGGEDRGDDVSLPRATVHRVSPTLGLQRWRRLDIARHRA